MLIPRLAISNFSLQKVRAALTVSAIALSISLVVSVTSGYSSIEASAAKFMGRFMGTADALITRKGDPHAQIAESVVQQLEADADVKRITGRLEVESPLVDSAGKPIEGRPAQIIGIRRPQDNRIENLTVNAGDWFSTSTGDVAVVDQVAAQKLGVGIGDSFSLPGPSGMLKVKVVGIVQKPAILASRVQSVYLPIETLQKFTALDQPPMVNRVMIDLKVSASIDEFSARWNPRLGAIDPELKLRLARDNRKELDRNLQGIHLLSYLGGAVSMLAATFIVFSALSMGVAERTRLLAMLRAVGALRGQVARLVILEGVALAAVGSAIGVPLGWVWIRLLSWKFKKVFTAGVTLSPGGILLGAGGSFLAAVLASALPAWRASRVRPLEAMSPLGGESSNGPPLLATVLGLLLIAVDPLNTFAPWETWLTGHVANPVLIARQIKFFGHFAFGLPALVLGFFLVAPLLVWVMEKLVGPGVAGVLGLRFALLRQQLSSGLWRAAGTCAALMVGLSILVAMETQGNTMLQGWQIPDKFPDIFIVSWTRGLTDAEIDKVAHLKGIRPGELMSIAVASPQLGDGGMFALGQMLAMPDATMFFGIEPEKGIKMMQLQFRQGNAADAVKMLNQGRHLIVTEEFHQIKHLNVGDQIPLQTSHGLVDYTIAAVVWSPGMDVVVSMFDMGRQFDQRTAASVFGSLDDAKRDFGVDSIRLFAANLQYFTEKEEVLKQVQGELGSIGLMAGDVRQIKHEIQTAFGDILLLVSLVPLAAMAVASLGVTNTIMASIRSRRWQLGVLRSVGLTQSQLLRLILAEAVLVGLVGCALGLGAGTVMTIDAHELTRVVIGYGPAIAVPWKIITAGTAAALVMAILASLWPAISIARNEPLALLQSGRGAA